MSSGETQCSARHDTLCEVTAMSKVLGKSACQATGQCSDVQAASCARREAPTVTFAAIATQLACSGADKAAQWVCLARVDTPAM